MQAHFNLGNYYRQTAKFEAAEFCYKAVVGVVPDHWRGLLNLAVAQVGLKRTSEAQKNLRRAFKASGARMHDSPCSPAFCHAEAAGMDMRLAALGDPLVWRMPAC